MEKIKFSILIPTRERADTLFHAIATCTAQDYENLNIIISDNFSQDNTKEVVLSFSDPRIKYINTGKRISMSHNWELALSHVTDGWVTIIGDDDGLLPGALAKVADIINKTGCQAIMSRRGVYYWPKCGAEMGSWPYMGIMDNSLIVPLSSGVELCNGREWLSKLMRGEAMYLDLPCLYTGGFADIVAINRARGPSGAFYLSMAPDVYSAIALASVLDTYVTLKEPVAICGVSSHSIGTSGFSKNNRDASSKFFSENNIPFHRSLAGWETPQEMPQSIQIHVYESYLQSTHLHHDFLKIKLEDQLSLALASTTKQRYANLRKYCSQVAHDNGIGMDTVDRKISKFRTRLFLQLLNKIVEVIIGQLNFSGNKHVMIRDAKEFGITNVYGAALLAKAIYLLETRYTNLKVAFLWRLIKSGLKNV